ncbi:MAG: NUDIX domain-containing protein [Thermodesulfobacteriota bacterium]
MQRREPEERKSTTSNEPAYRFCPMCGHELCARVLKVSEPERLVCEACQFVMYLDPKVAAGAIATIGGQVVLLRRGIEPCLGKWVFPGGFVDRGETVEQAVIRETKEEANLDVEIERLLNVYSYQRRPIVVIVYVVRIVGGDLQAGDETLEARTFPADRIPWDDLAFPSTRDALRDFVASLASRPAEDLP